MREHTKHFVAFGGEAYTPNIMLYEDKIYYNPERIYTINGRPALFTMETVGHLICRQATKKEVEDGLIAGSHDEEVWDRDQLEMFYIPAHQVEDWIKNAEEAGYRKA